MQKDMPPTFEPVHVTPFSAELAMRCSDLLDRPGLYDAVELEALVQRIYEREDLWRPLVIADPTRRRYELLYEDERIDIWVLSWMPGQGTGFHDHDISDVGVMCAQGELDEGLLVIGDERPPVRLRPGVSRNGPGGYIHSVTHVAGEPAVSLHAYSPPLMVVGQYRVDGDGRLRRDPEHGRRELYDRSIAARAAAVSPSRPV
jgi:predicted metal-dependent enzyme (double-stranded beta helix superfamily)